MKKIFKSYTFNILLIVSFTVLALWLTLKDGYEEVISILRDVNYSWIVAVLLIVLLIQFIIGIILTKLTKLSNPHYTVWEGFLNALVASFFHGITPSASGGQVAQVFVFKKQGVPVSDSASVLWMDFIIYQSTMCTTVLVLLLSKFDFFLQHFSGLFIFVLIGFLCNAAIIFGLWAVARFPIVYTFISTKGLELAHKVHLIKDKEKTLNNLKEQLDKFNTETIKLKKHVSLIVKCVVLNVIRCSLYYALPFFVFKALNFDLNSIQIFECMALTSFMAMIVGFIPIPGASGGTEAFYVIFFSVIAGGTAAKSTMILWRFMSYYLVMLIGAIAFIYVKISRGRDMFTKERLK